VLRRAFGAGLVKAFLERDCSVVANSRSITKSGAFTATDKLVLVDIGAAQTAAKVFETTISRFGTLRALVNNEGLFFAKPFTNYTVEDFRMLASTNLEGRTFGTGHRRGQDRTLVRAFMKTK
jgi:NAD(P)-dependent dehydrogenase (short-subunit alcohol dehydrogenase family)